MPACNKAVQTTFSDSISISLVFAIPSNSGWDFMQVFLGGNCLLVPKILTQLPWGGMVHSSVKMPLEKKKTEVQLQQHKAKSPLLYICNACALWAGLCTPLSMGVPIASDTQHHKELNDSLQPALAEAQLLPVQNKTSWFYISCAWITVLVRHLQLIWIVRRTSAPLTVLQRSRSIRQRKYRGLLVCIGKVHGRTAMHPRCFVLKDRNKRW